MLLCYQVLKAKKQTSISAISTPVTIACKKTEVALEWVPCIRYPIYFKRNKVQALFDSSNEVNVITLGFASKLGFKIRYTNIGAQKIDYSIFETFEMVLASFQIEDQFGQL